jgi:hypothetical protein
MYTEPCEAIFNEHLLVFRTALVGVGEAGSQVPVIVAEPLAGKFPRDDSSKHTFLDGLRTLGAASPLTASITHFLLHRSLPVDVRHNAKISREQLAVWAAGKLRQPLRNSSTSTRA